MFKITMIILVTIVAIGWIAYGIWRIVTHFLEKKRPKRTTGHLEQRKQSFERYINWNALRKNLISVSKEPYSSDGQLNVPYLWRIL
jgi:hypothetical protein